MRRVERGDGLHVGRGGDPHGPPVVFVHGAMDKGTAFLRATRELRDLDWWVYDRRGYGRSPAAVPPDVDGHLDDLATVLGEAGHDDGTPAVVVGHSLGGTLALAAAALRPERVRAVVAYEAPLSWMPWWPSWRPGGGRFEDDPPELAAERFLRRVAGDAAWEGLSPAARARRVDDARALVAELASLARAAPFDPAAVTAPVVVARGSHADRHRVRAADVLVAELPRAELVVVDGAGHGAHTAAPVAFADLVRRALERSGGAAAPARSL